MQNNNCSIIKKRFFTILGDPGNSMKTSHAFSIIIPVYHEAGAIEGCIAHLHDLTLDSAVEIVIVDGDPQGSTIKVIQDKQVIKSISQKGRARQMNRGASLASGDILLFLHADTLLPPDALAMVRSCMNNAFNVAGAFDLGIRTDRRIFRITERYVALRTRLTRIPYGDQAIFMRREYFEEIGGYKDIPLMEDVEIMQRIKKRGDRICIIPKKVMTSPRRWEQEGILFCTLRNLVVQFFYYLGVSPERLAKFYRS
jgi:rSAM/selenodomain-associated transferase 2